MSTSVNAGLIWDWNNMAFGSGFPITIDTDYHHKVEEGTTRATVAGDDTIEGVNHDRDAVQTRNVVKDKHVRVFLPVPNPDGFKESLDLIFSTNSMVSIDDVREQLSENSSEENVFGSSDQSDIIASTDEHYTAISGSIADRDGKGIIEYAEVINWTAENAGNAETFLEHNIDAGTVTIGFANDQRKTTIRMSEERFLEMSGYVQASNGMSSVEVGGEVFYYNPNEVNLVDALPALSQEEAVEQSVKSFSRRFFEGFGNSVVDNLTSVADLLGAYVEFRELLLNDKEAFDSIVREVSSAAIEAVQHEEFWVDLAESIVEDLKTPEGLGRATADMAMSAGIIGRIAKFKKIAFLQESLLRKYWKREIKFDGKKVYQRDDLFDVGKVDAEGLSNLELMKAGKAPKGVDGKPINLHHSIQAEGSPIVETLHSMHEEYRRLIHINIPSRDFPSGIDRSKFDAWRKKYWKARAEQIEKGLDL